MPTNKQHPNRVELYLDDSLYNWLRRKAFAENRKMTEVVRELLQSQKDKGGESAMVISQKAYRDCIVMREDVIVSGADWREHPDGERQIRVRVIRKGSGPDGHDEVLLNNDPLFQEAVEATK